MRSRLKLGLSLGRARLSRWSSWSGRSRSCSGARSKTASGRPGTRLTTPETIHAFKLTLIITAIAVPVNTVFGIVCALAIVRRRFPGKGLLNAFIDLPLALSPVVVGLALFLLYGRDGWFGGWLDEHGIQVLFALPAMIIATIFVSLPFVAREVVPTLREIGDEQEQAARTLGASGWQTFWRITLAVDPLGGGLRRRSSRPRGASASTAPSQSSQGACRVRPRRRRSACRSVRRASISPARMRSLSCSRRSRSLVLCRDDRGQTQGGS